MPEIIHFVRHAQGHHNVKIANHQMHDPDLTALGEQQCRELAAKFPYMSNINLVVASPLRRTVNTALISFKPQIENKGLKVLGLPDLQEVADLPCDTGTDPDLLKIIFSHKPVDLGLVEEGWNSNQGKYGCTTEELMARAKRARQWLFARPEKEIVCVTHGSFLHYLTEDWSDANRFRGTGWSNTEFRTFRITNARGDNPFLKETRESEDHRLGHETALTFQDQVELHRVAEKDNEAQTLQMESDARANAEAMCAKSAL
ncbi:MAG: hypothetical protein M4579_000403 [Chaenotheca gracillima]|nr:MAG: hypothetical protein M4579_000403 [Chaenotheca gracillima]